MTDIDDNIFVINDTGDGNDTKSFEQNEEQLYNDGAIEASEAAMTSNAIDAQDINTSNISDRDKDKSEIDAEDDDDVEGLIPLCVRHTAGPKLSTAAFGYDIAEMNKRPWRNPAANLSDYFNYGFNEKSWRLYCAMQEKGSESVLSKANEMLSMLENKRHIDNVAATNNNINDHYHYYQGRDGKPSMQTNDMFTRAPQEQRLYNDRSIPPPPPPLPPQFATQNTLPYTHSRTPQPPQSSDDNNINSSSNNYQKSSNEITNNEQHTSVSNNANIDQYSEINDSNLNASSKASPENGKEEQSMYLARSNPLAPPGALTEHTYSYERELPSQYMPQHASNYKTKLCQRFMDGHCARGSECNYAHGVAELRSFAPRQMPQPSFVTANYFSSPMSAQPSSALPPNTMMPNYEMYDQRYMSYTSSTPTQRFVAPPVPQSSAPPPQQQQSYVANTTNMQGAPINDHTASNMNSNNSINSNDNVSNEEHSYVE